MSFKHLLVHLDGGERAVPRLELAAKLAERLGAGLTGLFAEQRSSHRGRPDTRRSADEVARSFSERVRMGPGGAEWWQIPNDEFDIGGVAARYARYADLAIVGQPDLEDPFVPADLAEQLLLESGRPVLVIPFSGTFSSVGQKTVIAWDGSREAARALNDALPILVKAQHATVALLRGPRDRVALEDHATPSILRHLAQHGVKAKYEVLVIGREGNGPDALGAVLNLAADLGADLVVMGGHGTHGTPFPGAGRAARAALAMMATPVLIAT